MRAGTMRHRVTVNRLVDAGPSASGQRLRMSAIFAEVWADISALSGREAVYAQTFAATVSHKIVIRYLAGLLPTDQVLFYPLDPATGSSLPMRFFAINAVTDPEERRREMVLYATEIAQPIVDDDADLYELLADAEYALLTDSNYAGMT